MNTEARTLPHSPGVEPPLSGDVPDYAPGDGDQPTPVPMTAGRGNRVLRRLTSNRVAVVAFCFVVLLILVALASPWLMPHDPARQDLINRLQGPSGDHWLGTDSLGRDNLSRLIEGTRVTLLAALQATAIGVGFGIPTGLLAGFLGKRIDTVMSRIADVFLAMPPLIAAMAIVAVLGPGLTNAMIALGLVFAPRMFRISRAAALSVRSETYVEATRAMGCSMWRIVFRHVLPNSAGPLLVMVTLGFGGIVTAEASLSFLGLGAAPPTATWGAMMRDALNNIYQTKFQLIGPSVMITLTILAFSLLGDGLRDALGRQTRVGE